MKSEYFKRSAAVGGLRFPRSFSQLLFHEESEADYCQHQAHAPDHAENAAAFLARGSACEPRLRACPGALAHLSRQEFHLRRAVGVQGDRVVGLQIQLIGYEKDHESDEAHPEPSETGSVAEGVNGNERQCNPEGPPDKPTDLSRLHR